eukprot:snap_masked-scaffold_43-processed-gene-1.51-mRNA-1 protein AED:1.00 eAED:1.00 QI:0/-1/0/0/-1/1/1/0/109
MSNNKDTQNTTGSNPANCEKMSTDSSRSLIVTKKTFWMYEEDFHYSQLLRKEERKVFNSWCRVIKEMNKEIYTLNEQKHNLRDRIAGGHQPHNPTPSVELVETLDGKVE